MRYAYGNERFERLRNGICLRICSSGSCFDINTNDNRAGKQHYRYTTTFSKSGWYSISNWNTWIDYEDITILSEDRDLPNTGIPSEIISYIFPFYFFFVRNT